MLAKITLAIDNTQDWLVQARWVQRGIQQQTGRGRPSALLSPTSYNFFP
jgi:hypothetical protein